jgi:hypothetical protein
MSDILNSLTISDWLQALSIIFSTLISIVSIFIAISTLKQTNKITKEANRPYIVIFIDAITLNGSSDKYLIIKNFGNTSATINSIECSSDIDFCAGLNPFKNLKNLTIAPGQSISTYCNFDKNKEAFTCSINYFHQKDIYNDIFDLNPSYTSGLLSVTRSTSNMSSLERTLWTCSNELIRSKF